MLLDDDVVGAYIHVCVVQRCSVKLKPSMLNDPPRGRKLHCNSAIIGNCYAVTLSGKCKLSGGTGPAMANSKCSSTSCAVATHHPTRTIRIEKVYVEALSTAWLDKEYTLGIAPNERACCLAKLR
jgi:hypothetical protein